MIVKLLQQRPECILMENGVHLYAVRIRNLLIGRSMKVFLCPTNMPFIYGVWEQNRGYKAATGLMG